MADSVAQWCGAPSSGPLSFHGPEALLWLWDTLPVPASSGALGSASSTGPSQGNLPWPATPNTAFNMIPLSFRLGRVPRHGQCALVLCPPPRAGPVLLCPNSKAKMGGIHPPPCPAMVLKLQDNVNLVSLAQQGCCCSSEPPVMPAEAVSLSKGLRTWSWPHKMVGSTSRSQARCVCLMRDTVQFLPSLRLGCGGPKQEYILMAWFLSSILCWNSGSRLRDQEGCHGRPLPTNPVHGIPRGTQHLLLSMRLGHS